MLPLRDEEEVRKVEERRKLIRELWEQLTLQLWRDNRRRYRDILKRIKQLEGRP